MKKFIYLLALFAVLNFELQICSAEIKPFHSETSYIMKKSESIKDAQDIAFKKAVRIISEEANIFIDSLSQLKNNQLQSDRIETFTATILKIKSKNFDKELMSDGNLKIIVTVDAEMDTDNANELFSEILDARNANKNYEEILTDYTKRKNTFDTVYGEYINSYQKRIMQKILEGCKLANVGKFDEAITLYTEAINESIANDAEISFAYIKRGLAYAMQNKLELAGADLQKAIALNNDSAGMHLMTAIQLENSGDKVKAAQEYRAFVKEADTIYYNLEILEVLDKIVELEEAN